MQVSQYGHIFPKRLGRDFFITQQEVGSIVTDAHWQIAAIMKTTVTYKNVKHQWDVWHGSKNLVKKLSPATKQKMLLMLRRG